MVLKFMDNTLIFLLTNYWFNQNNIFLDKTNYFNKKYFLFKFVIILELNIFFQHKQICIEIPITFFVELGPQ